MNDLNTYIMTRNDFKKNCDTKRETQQKKEREKLVSSLKDPKCFWKTLKTNSFENSNTISNKISTSSWFEHFKGLLYSNSQTCQNKTERYMFNNEFGDEFTDNHYLNDPIYLKMKLNTVYDH